MIVYAGKRVCNRSTLKVRYTAAMYQLLLILKYLVRKIAPLIAAIAVSLCTAMVIIVISVMGGFLDMLETSIQRTTGDVIVYRGGLSTFPHYPEMIRRIEALPQAKAATPIIESYALLTVDRMAFPVKVVGIEPRSFNAVTPFEKNLVWDQHDMVEHIEQSFANELLEDTRQQMLDQYLDQWRNIDIIDLTMDMKTPDRWQPDPGNPLPAMVVGIEVNPYHTRDEQGQYGFRNSLPLYFSESQNPITLTTTPISGGGSIDDMRPERRSFIVVNEYKSGHYDVDSLHVFVPFAVLQNMLDLEAFEGYEADQFDPATGLPKPDATLTTNPAETTRVLVKAAIDPATGEPYDLEVLRDQVEDIVRNMIGEHRDMPALFVQTWQQANARLLGAVGNEKGLVTFLFVIISIVAIFMVSTTFWTLVQNKTRDIGIMRAIGASRFGVLTLFLGYGLAIGIVGAVSGFFLASAIVTNLNEIQEVIAQTTGWRMWDPRIYAFDRIPSRLDMGETLPIVIGSIISSVVGSLIAALRAATLDPIEALRYE